MNIKVHLQFIASPLCFCKVSVSFNHFTDKHNAINKEHFFVCYEERKHFNLLPCKEKVLKN